MNIDIISGFFESGKTTFINKYIEKEIVGRYEKVLLLNCEYGVETYRFEQYESTEIKVINISNKDDFNVDKIDFYVNESDCDYVLVELNGVWDISYAINSLRKYNIKNIITILDYNTMDLYISNMESYMIDKISNSDIVVLNKLENHNEEEIDLRYKLIRSINRGCDIFIFEEMFLYDEDIIQNKYFSNSDMELLRFGALFLIFLLFSFVIKNVFSDFYNDQFQRILGVFISLIIQILPFLLIGSIVSGIIQIIVPSDKISGIFKKTSFKSIFLALFAGIFFPVCDCAMIPISTSIVKKGYSYPVAITFLLAAPAINPVVILSTYYAFPNMTSIVLYRIVTGLILAFLVGVVLMFVDRKRKITIVNEHINKYQITDITTEKLYFKNKLRYFEAIILHTKKEFFKMGYYVVFGAFISSCLQVLVPRSVFLDINSVNSLSVISMIVAGFFISICSTSNAFIARSFYNIMPLNSILAFMVVGPIIDITNISVMFGTFKKKFLLMLMLLVIYISFVMYSLMGGVMKIV